MTYTADEDHDHLHVLGDLHLPAPRFWWTLLVVLMLAAGVAVVWRTVFFVDETKYVYVTQFGRPVQLYTEPGLAVKWPYQSLWRFDRRLQMFEPPGREMLTEDKENLNFHWYVCWRIAGQPPLEEADDSGRKQSVVASAGGARDVEQHVRRFLESVGTMDAAERRLEERVQAALAAEVARTRLSQLVSLDPSQLKLAQMEDHVLRSIQPVALEQFGIELVDVRLKRFTYPEAVKPAVFAEIRSERQRVAVQHRAEGASQKTRLESLATLQRDQLLAQAEREAARIRGEGEAKSIEILNAAHSKNPEFYSLLKTLEAYRKILDEQTTVVLSADSPLLKLLSEGLPPLTNPSPQTPATAASASESLDSPAERTEQSEPVSAVDLSDAAPPPRTALRSEARP